MHRVFAHTGGRKRAHGDTDDETATLVLSIGIKAWDIQKACRITVGKSNMSKVLTRVQRSTEDIKGWAKTISNDQASAVFYDKLTARDYEELEALGSKELRAISDTKDRLHGMEQRINGMELHIRRLESGGRQQRDSEMPGHQVSNLLSIGSSVLPTRSGQSDELISDQSYPSSRIGPELSQKIDDVAELSRRNDELLGALKCSEQKREFFEARINKMQKQISQGSERQAQRSLTGSTLSPKSTARSRGDTLRGDELRKTASKLPGQLATQSTGSQEASIQSQEASIQTDQTGQMSASTQTEPIKEASKFASSQSRRGSNSSLRSYTSTSKGGSLHIGNRRQSLNTVISGMLGNITDRMFHRDHADVHSVVTNVKPCANSCDIGSHE